MKIGFNTLLWGGHLTDDLFPHLEGLKAAGYDGVEFPIFDVSDPAHYTKVGKVLDDLGLSRCSVTICPTDAQSLISTFPSHRQAGIDHLKKVVECGQNAGIENICGPFYQELCNFTGKGATEEEKAWAAEGHRQMADAAQAANIRLTVESLNRFECHFLNTMAQAKAYVQQVNHPNFFTMYDTFHANIEEKDPLGVIEPNLDVIKHVHISANDRGTPGKDHTPIRETIQIFQRNGYDNWYVIEAFGDALPELAAATRVWRPLFESPEECYTDGLKYIKDSLAG